MDVFLLEKAGWQPVRYLLSVLLLENYMSKKDTTYWRCMRVGVARRAGCLVF